MRHEQSLVSVYLGTEQNEECLFILKGGPDVATSDLVVLTSPITTDPTTRKRLGTLYFLKSGAGKEGKDGFMVDKDPLVHLPGVYRGQGTKSSTVGHL